jgi:hypothetical protein
MAPSAPHFGCAARSASVVVVDWNSLRVAIQSEFEWGVVQSVGVTFQRMDHPAIGAPVGTYGFPPGPRAPPAPPAEIAAH